MSILHVRMNILQVKMIEVTELQPLLLGGSVTAGARTRTGRSRTWDWEAVRSEAASRLEPLLLGGGVAAGAGTRTGRSRDARAGRSRDARAAGAGPGRRRAVDRRRVRESLRRRAYELSGTGEISS